MLWQNHTSIQKKIVIIVKVVLLSINLLIEFKIICNLCRFYGAPEVIGTNTDFAIDNTYINIIYI